MIIVLCMLTLGLRIVHCQEQTVIRATSYGTVEGYTVRLSPQNDTDDRMMDVFVGIPYAQPPVGTLRWQRPEIPVSWEVTRPATEFSPCCPQILENLDSSFGPDYNNTNEDCLYLNIYAPRESSIEVPSATYPVMVWIHGGANRYGCGEEYDGRILPKENVVIVTFNYRLGVLGYLSTDDQVSPGNFALLDQVLALQWVHDNIANFGGDPDDVTLFGNSAGGSHTSLMMFSTLSEGLFHKVISQSGSAMSPWAVYRPPNSIRPNTEYLANEFNCPTDSSQEMVDCLMEVDANDLVYTYVPSATPSNGAFAPNVDGYFLTDTPENLFDRGEYQRVPFFSGNVPDETSNEFAGEDDGFTRAEKEAEMYSRSRRYGDAADRVFDAFLQEYDLPGEDMQEQRDLFMELRSDNEYIAPHNKHARLHSSEVPQTFLYTFEHRADSHPYPEWMGVPHFEECYYIFGVPFWGEASACPWGCRNIMWFPSFDWNPTDEQVSRDMMNLWTNFAKSGIPSSGDYKVPQFNETEENYGILQSSPSVDQFYKHDRVSFNNIYLPKMLNKTECF